MKSPMHWTRELIDNLVPFHERTSCDDAKLGNGLETAKYHGRTAPRCVRCALLECVDYHQGVLPPDFECNLQILLRPRES